MNRSRDTQKVRGVKLSLLAVGALIVSLLIAELACQLLSFCEDSDPVERIEGGLKWKHDPDLGYKPIPNAQARERGYFDEKLMYDVTYTINDKGLRVTPASDALAGVFFFGGSFAFGNAVGDEKTIPYRVAVSTDGSYSVFNLGYSGYGANQMLSSMESGAVARMIPEVTPAYVIYQALPYHVMRAAGTTKWGPAGPRYHLQGEDLVRDGLFMPRDGAPGSFKASFRNFIRKSALGDRILDYRRRPSQQDVDLMVAIVRRSKELCEARWPGSEFHTILWPYRDQDVAKIEKGLLDSGITLHRITDIIPDYASNAGAYVIPYDEHPNAHACGLVAKYIVDNIVMAKSVADLQE